MTIRYYKEKIMKSNRSLGISNRIQEFQKANIIGLLAEEYPKAEMQEIENTHAGRNRVFSASDTLLTMILTASQSDKTLKNSVTLYHSIHQDRRKELLKINEIDKDKEKTEEENRGKKSRGRPKKYKIQKSLEKDISLNTASYSNARQRISIEMVEKLFKATRLSNVKNEYSHWHGYQVMISDGTYVQMQDTPELREIYEVKHKGEASSGYPQGLLQVVIDRGSGQLQNFALSNRHKSELELFYGVLDELPEGCIILLDDLYNCYEIIAKCKKRNIEIVVPAKRMRNYIVEETIAEGDEIIRINIPKERSSWLKEHVEIPKFLQLRRISSISPEGKEYISYTTILKKEIKKEEIQALYLSRWDIEIGIREIKTIMDINILRAKTPSMIFKELAISLATYNLIRKIIYASIKDLPFFPKTDFIYKFYTNSQNLLIDKKGRLYNRWSTGRKRAFGTYPKGNVTQKTSSANLSPKNKTG